MSTRIHHRLYATWCNASKKHLSHLFAFIFLTPIFGDFVCSCLVAAIDWLYYLSVWKDLPIKYNLFRSSFPGLVSILLIVPDQNGKFNHFWRGFVDAVFRISVVRSSFFTLQTNFGAHQNHSSLMILFLRTNTFSILTSRKKFVYYWLAPSLVDMKQMRLQNSI